MLVIFLYMEVLLFSNQKVPYKAFKVSKPTSYKNAQHQNQLRCWATEAPVLFVSINVFGFKDLILKLPTYSSLFPGVTQYPTPSFEKVWSVTTRNTSVQSITDSMTSMSTYPSPKTQRSTLSTLLQKSHLWLTHSSTQPRDFKSDSKKLLFFLCCICLSRLLKHYESLWAIIYFIEMTWT